MKTKYFIFFSYNTFRSIRVGSIIQTWIKLIEYSYMMNKTTNGMFILVYVRFYIYLLRNMVLEMFSVLMKIQTKFSFWFSSKNYEDRATKCRLLYIIECLVSDIIINRFFGWKTCKNYEYFHPERLGRSKLKKKIHIFLTFKLKFNMIIFIPEKCQTSKHFFLFYSFFFWIVHFLFLI